MFSFIVTINIREKTMYVSYKLATHIVYDALIFFNTNYFMFSLSPFGTLKQADKKGEINST